MLVVQHKRKQKHIAGSRFAAKFLTTHKDTITNLADVVGSVAKASANTATAAKQIYDVVKNRKDVYPRNDTINKMLSAKSNDILTRLTDAEVNI